MSPPGLGERRTAAYGKNSGHDSPQKKDEHREDRKDPQNGTLLTCHFLSLCRPFRGTPSEGDPPVVSKKRCQSSYGLGIFSTPAFRLTVLGQSLIDSRLRILPGSGVLRFNIRLRLAALLVLQPHHPLS